jgi:hypothetical protein
MIKSMTLLVLTLFFGAAANADFSYTTTRKTTGGMMASMGGAAGPQTSKFYLKGQKMKLDHGSTATIIDFDAQTITTNTAQKTYAVKGFNDVAQGTKPADIQVKMDVKETGQKKTVNGYSASELIATMEVESPQSRQMGKMQLEVDMWLSADVQGRQELHDFYQRNAGKFPWAAMVAAANPSMQQAMGDLQRKLASINGVPVQQIVRMKGPGGADGPAAGPSADQMAQMQAGMAKACPQMQAMIAQGGPAAAMVKQQYDRMCGATSGAATGATPGATPGSSANALMEMTMDSSDFSSGAIPDSVFAIPDGFQKSN